MYVRTCAHSHDYVLNVIEPRSILKPVRRTYTNPQTLINGLACASISAVVYIRLTAPSQTTSTQTKLPDRPGLPPLSPATVPLPGPCFYNTTARHNMLISYLHKPCQRHPKPIALSLSYYEALKSFKSIYFRLLIIHFASFS